MSKPSTRFHSPVFIIGCLLLLLAQACAVNPVTGKRELMFYSEQDEIAMGKQTHAQIVQQYGLYDNQAVNAYVRRVGNSLTGHTHRPHLEYYFGVLDSPVVNAFAVPGGYIYVTRGILAMMNSEAELAVVLAHELGHVNARHSMRRLSNIMLASVGIAAGSAISKTFADLAGIAGVGMQLLFLQYSRNDEREADELGVLYSRKGKYNPAKMVDFFLALERMGDLSGGQSLPGFLSTHPLTSERIENTRTMIDPGDQGLKVEAPGYVKRLDGLVFGPDPRQGYVEEGAFYHPTLRFVFRFPAGWKVQNLPSQVTMIAPEEDAAVILQAEQSSQDPRAFAAAKAQQLENATLQGEQATRVNGLSAYQQVWDVTQEQGEPIRAQMTFIRYGPHIYSFTALSLRKDFDAFTGAFDATSSSFRELTDRRYLNRQPVRLRLVNADGRRTLREIFRQNKMSEKIWPQFAIMNALELDQTPARGATVKIIR